MRFVFSPPAAEAAGLLTLPFDEPLEEWQDERLIEIRQAGLSRHVVRFVAEGGVLYALKSISERLARREYRLLRALAELNVPAVEVVGIVVDRGPDLDAILVTRFLEYSTTYRALFSSPRVGQPTDRLLDALVELLVRLHLSGFFWGDCSLSNTLFRYDAGTLAAYLVDAETSEQHPALIERAAAQGRRARHRTDRRRAARPPGGRAAAGGVDPLSWRGDLSTRTSALWDELTREEKLRPQEQRYRIAERLRRLNDLGFDADELELISTPDGNKLRIRTKVAETGQHSAQLFRQTGISADEHQARRLLNDIASFRGYLEQKSARPVSETSRRTAGSRRSTTPWWRRSRSGCAAAPPPEIFHEILEHRWYLSEQAGHDVGTTAAATSYFETVLPTAPDPLTAGTDDPRIQPHSRPLRDGLWLFT